MQNSIDNFYNFTISTSVALSNRCELFPIDKLVHSQSQQKSPLSLSLSLSLCNHQIILQQIIIIYTEILMLNLALLKKVQRIICQPPLHTALEKGPFLWEKMASLIT